MTGGGGFTCWVILVSTEVSSAWLSVELTTSQVITSTCSHHPHAALGQPQTEFLAWTPLWPSLVYFPALQQGWISLRDQPAVPVVLCRAGARTPVWSLQPAACRWEGDFINNKQTRRYKMLLSTLTSQLVLKQIYWKGLGINQIRLSL